MGFTNVDSGVVGGYLPGNRSSACTGATRHLGCVRQRGKPNSKVLGVTAAKAAPSLLSRTWIRPPLVCGFGGSAAAGHPSRYLCSTFFASAGVAFSHSALGWKRKLPTEIWRTCSVSEGRWLCAMIPYAGPRGSPWHACGPQGWGRRSASKSAGLPIVLLPFGATTTP